MQRLRLTEDFAIEFGDYVSRTFNSLTSVSQDNAPLHIIKNPVLTDNKVLLLNADGSVTNNVREISAFDRNQTYHVLLARTPHSYTEVLWQNFSDTLHPNFTQDGLQYIQCKLYTVAGFNWAKDIAGVWLKVSQTINGVEYQLANKVILRSTLEQYQFKPIRSNAVVLDNEQFTMCVDFDILDLQYVANTKSESINTLRNALFGKSTSFTINANIEVAIGLIYSADIHSFEDTLKSDNSTIATFNQFALREIKRAPLITPESSDIYALSQYIASTDNANAYIRLALLHRQVPLDTWIASMNATGSVILTYDIIVSPFNQEGELIASQSQHIQLSNLASPTAELKYIPVIADSDNISTKPYMCILYCTATLLLQNDLGDMRFSRSTQILLNQQQLRNMCWLKQPNVTFDTHELIHTQQIKQQVIQQLNTSAKDRILQVKMPEYLHIMQIVVNDNEVAAQSTVTIPCAKDTNYNVSIQFIDANNDIIQFTQNTAFIAKSGKGIVKDALTRSTTYVEFALSNNEGKSTTWDILTADNKFIQRIILES